MFPSPKSSWRITHPLWKPFNDGLGIVWKKFLMKSSELLMNRKSHIPPKHLPNTRLLDTRTMNDSTLPIPEEGRYFRHHSGRIYQVMTITNQSANSERFPITVVYRNTTHAHEHWGEVYSRPLKEFWVSFTPCSHPFEGEG